MPPTDAEEDDAMHADRRYHQTRHDTSHRPGYRVRWQDSFLGRSLTWRLWHGPPLPPEQATALTTRILIEEGFVICRRYTRCWPDADLDAEAQRLGVSVVRAGEAALEVCPRCTLYARLLTVLQQRLGDLPGAQLELF